MAAHAGAAAGPPAGQEGTDQPGGSGGRAPHHLPPGVHGPHPHRQRVRPAQAAAPHCAGSDRFRRDQDLCASGAGHRHRGGNGGSRRRQQRRPGGAATGQSVRPERGARRLQAQRLPAQLRVQIRRAAERPARPQPDRQGHGRPRKRLRVMSDIQPRTPPIQSKLPAVGTTIFTVMSALATEHGAVNLGQGFPDFECDPQLVRSVTDAMTRGLNQYPPMPGIPALREAVAAKIESGYGHHYDPATEITITAGATQAIITAILAVVRPGDEVIVLEPCYDSYVPNIELAGGTVVRVPLTPHTFGPDFAKIAAAITPRTRAILVNTPHNPSATVWTAQEMRQLEELLAPTDVF